MATNVNWKLAIAVLALAVVGYSFIGGSPTGAQVVTTANAWCKDTDMQNNMVAGNCEDSSGIKASDSCVDFNTVNEAFCSKSNICTKKYMNCRYGETCVSGACVAD